MITSDTQMERPKPVPAGEAPKDDLAVNSHPADGTGAPVLDGELHHTERPNVNAMREAIETQSEMEVGKLVNQKQDEVKAEGKGVTVDKGSGTQIIINIAGKQKNLGFSNKATAVAFIKGATAKFGNKFKMVAASFEYVIQVGDNQFVDIAPLRLTTLDEAHRFAEGDDFTALAVKVKNSIANGERVKIVPAHHAKGAAVTSGMSDIDGGAPSFKTTAKKASEPHGYPLSKEECRAQGHSSSFMNSSTTCSQCGATEREEFGGEEEQPVKKYRVYTGPTLVQQTAEKLRAAGCNVTIEGTEHVHFTTDKPREEVLQLLREPNQAGTGAVGWSDRDIKEASKKRAGGMNFSPSNVPSQVVQEFYPELQHELISYPNVTNSPMVNPEISGDQHTLGTAPAEGIGEAVLQIEGDNDGATMEGGELLPGALEDAFDQMTIVSYVSTSPAGACGIGRDGKSQVLEGAPLRKELDIRGPMFTDEFYQNYQAVPGAALAALKEKVAGADEKKQFALFLKRVMGEVAASFLAAFKVTFRPPMNKVPGVGEIRLTEIEQPVTSVFNIINTGSRVKYLMDKLTDSEVQDAINGAFAQAAVWCEEKENGYVYEVFVRAETIDTDSMILSYRFVTGTRETE